MLHMIRTLLLGSVLLLMMHAPCPAQRVTTWLGGAGEWYEDQAWTDGVPNEISIASIPVGEVLLPPGKESPAVFALELARSPQDGGVAMLTVEEANLIVSTRLWVAETSLGDAIGQLKVLGGAPESGNVFLDDIIIGVVTEQGHAEGVVELEGDLRRVSRDRGGTLVVGQNRGKGGATGFLQVGRSIGDPKLGFSNVMIGHVAEGAGEARGEVHASQLQNNGGQLFVGMNTSNSRNSFAAGHLVIDAIRGYDNATFGLAEIGEAEALVEVGSLYVVGDTVLGTPDGRGRGHLMLRDQAVLAGAKLTVNRGSTVSFGAQVDAEVINAGRAMVTNRSDGLPGGIVRMNNLVTQTLTGVWELDVVGRERGQLYEAIDLADGGALQGRLQINFGADYLPRIGDQFEFVRSAGPLDTKQLGWQFRNIPSDLAIEFLRNEQAVIAKFVQPSQQEFVNLPGSDFSWEDSSIWTNQQLPRSVEDITLLNRLAAPQSVHAIDGAMARSIVIDGGKSGMLLHIPAGASLTTTHGIHVKSLGQITMDGGKLLAGSLTVDAQASFQGSGQIAGDVIQQGLLAVGLEVPASLYVDGDFTQLSQGWLEMDVWGIEPGQFDQIYVDGDLNLAGTLNLNLLDLDAIGPDARIPLLQATGGIFGNLTLRFENQVGEIPLGLDSFLDPDSGETTIMLLSGPGPGILGDMNWDLSVDECDLDAFALSLQDVDTYTDYYVFEPSHIGDINDDGQFDVDDIQPFFELVNGVGCGAEALPEPGSASLLAMGALVMLAVRVRRKGICDGP